jgi:hypothetical protein
MAAVPLFSCLVRWDERDSMWEVALPKYSWGMENQHVWTYTPHRYCVSNNLFTVLVTAKREHLRDAVLNRQRLYFVYGDDPVEITTDDVILDILLTHGHI